MRYTEVASRYARALFLVAQEKSNVERIFSELRALRSAIRKDEELVDALSSPLIKGADRELAVQSAFAERDVSAEVESFFCLLARKNRLGLFSEIVDAFEHEADEANGVTRGTVRSAGVLSPEERAEIEKIVAKATGKRVILSYQEDSSLIGGLVAEVGSFTFDDSILSHLRRLHEDLKRRAH